MTMHDHTHGEDALAAIRDMLERATPDQLRRLIADIKGAEPQK